MTGLQLDHAITYPNIGNVVFKESHFAQYFQRNFRRSHLKTFATNPKLAITHLANAAELQTMYHLIGKGKVPEQHI